VDILIDETKLPEGTDEDVSVFDAELVDVNTRVEQVDDSVCRVDDILMAW
jgi:hypothetical protein